MKRAEPREPILLLTPDDYRRATSEGAPEGSSPRSSMAPAILLVVVAGAAAGAAVGWIDWSSLRVVPPAAPAVAARVPRRTARPVEPPPPAVAPRAEIPRLVDEPEDPPSAAPIVAVEPPRLWNGGRAWARIRLRVERGSQVQESEHRISLAWNGSRFVVERASAPPSDLAADRLELLLHLPSEEEGWRRQVAATRTEALALEGRTLTCRRVEGEDRFPEGVRRFRYWYSEEFPAGAVQAEQRMGEFTLLSRVLDFGAAPPERKAGR